MIDEGVAACDRIFSAPISSILRGASSVTRTHSYAAVINHSIITRSDTRAREVAIFARQSELTAITRYARSSSATLSSPTARFSLPLPLNYVATFGAFHGRSNIRRNCALASFIASFGIETEFTIAQ